MGKRRIERVRRRSTEFHTIPSSFSVLRLLHPSPSRRVGSGSRTDWRNCSFITWTLDFKKGVWIKFNFNFCWGCELKTWFLSNRITARPQDFIFQSWRTSGLEKRAIVNVGIGKRKLSDRSRYPDFLPVPYINEEKNKWEPKTRMPKWNDFA